MYTDKQITRYFNLAKQASLLSTQKYQIGACIVYKGKVLTTNYNKGYSHPYQKLMNKYRSTNDRYYDIDKMSNNLHAEIACMLDIRHLKLDYSKVSIFIYRHDKVANKGKLACPCGSCSKALDEYGVKNIYYSTNNEWIYERR